MIAMRQKLLIYFNKIRFCQSILSIFINPFFLYRFFLFKLIKKFTKKNNSLKILDVGCGEKLYASYFKSKYYFGIDIPLDFRVNNHIHNPDIIFDGKNFPFSNNSFDLILLFEVIEHVDIYDDFLYNLSCLLKKKSILLLSTPFFWGLHEEPFDFQRLSSHKLNKIKYFDNIQCFEIGNIYVSFFQTINSFLYKFSGKKLFLFFIPLFFFNNICGFLLSFINSTHKNTFPIGYFCILRK